MIYIAHRALFDGPNPAMENHPDQIDLAISNGFDCEIDLRLIGDKIWLGHDGPQYEVDVEFLSNRHRNLWVHCKNIEAMEALCLPWEFPMHYFWHQEDDYFWTYPGKPLPKINGICVQPERDENFLNIKYDCRGICSKFVKQLSEK